MSETHLPPGTSLDGGRYVVERVLGEGGFGITYLCQEPSLARQVAIKEYFPLGGERSQGHLTAGRLGFEEVQSGLRRFEKEARSLAAPHIFAKEVPIAVGFASVRNPWLYRSAK